MKSAWSATAVAMKMKQKSYGDKKGIQTRGSIETIRAFDTMMTMMIRAHQLGPSIGTIHWGDFLQTGRDQQHYPHKL